MKDFDSIILFVFGTALVVALFLGAKKFIISTIDSAPTVQKSSEAEERLRAQRDQVRDTREQQKRLMEDRKRKMRDMQRR